MKKYGDYRDYLRTKGIKPLVIERTKRKKGDLVLISSCLPVEHVR